MRTRMWTTVRLALVTALALLVLFPFIYALLASFFSAGDFATSPARILPSSWSFRNYQRALSNRHFPTYMLNSLVTGVMSALGRMVIAMLASYALAYFRFAGRKFIFALLALTLFIPGDLLLSGNYLTIQRLGLLDSWLGIISTSLVPASQILMLRQFFLSIPASIRDSAAMDGASDRRYIISILIPISRAVISTLLLQSFVSMFNSYLWPLLVTNRTDMRTVQIGITMLGYAESLDYGPIFAAIVIVLIPFLAVFILMHRRIMASLRQGYMFM